MGSDTENNRGLPPSQCRKKHIKLLIGISLGLLFFLLCGRLGFWLAQQVFDPLVPVTGNEDVDPAYQSDSVLNILLLGIDQREEEAARADTIILASLDLKDKEVRLLSIPRDTRAEISGQGITRKINHAHAVGGAELTVKTVEDFLGLPVHYYVEANFEGFVRCIDILGGITINVERRMYLPAENIDLRPGLQKLNGEDALAYVRWRGDGKGDIGRIERQQKFFRALAEQARHFSTVWKIPELLGELREQVATDMSAAKMIALANKFKDLDAISLSVHTVPGVPDDVHYGGSYWVADKSQLAALLKEFYGN